MPAVPCTVLCLLALSLNFRPSPDIQKCAYCAQMRGLSLLCEQKPWVCAEQDPDSLIYCLSRDERPWGRDALKRSTRCISHSDLFNQSLLLISRDALSQELTTIPSASEQHCAFELSQQCHCPDCQYEGSGEVEVSSADDEQQVDLATELQNIAVLLDKLIVEEQQQKTVETVTRKTSRRTLPPRLAAASAPIRPLPPLRSPSSGEKDEKFLIPFPMDFLHSGAIDQHRMFIVGFPAIIAFLLIWPIHFVLLFMFFDI